MMKKCVLLLSFYVQDAKYKLGVKVVSYLLLLASIPAWLASRDLSVKLLLASHRANYNKFSGSLIRMNLRRIACRIDEQDMPTDSDMGHIMGRSIVLKKPIFGAGGVQEKGILLIKFTETFAFFLKYVNCERLLRDFHVVLEPSWVGQAVEEVLGWTKYRNHLVYVQTADEKDFYFLEGLGANLVPMRIGSGEFVDHRVFRPIGNKKEFDCVCIANYSDYKRLHAYVIAVKKLVHGNPGFKAALICAPWGRRRGQIFELIELLGVKKNIHVFEKMKQQELNDILDRSYVNMLLSYREGASKVLFESLFVDVPSIVLKENIGVNKSHFNEKTGIVAAESELPEAISSVRRNHAQYAPRSWAMENISPEVTLGKISKVICDRERDGKPFLSKTFIKVNIPEARYMHEYLEIDRGDSKAMVAAYIRRASDVVLSAVEEGEIVTDDQVAGETLA